MTIDEALRIVANERRRARHAQNREAIRAYNRAYYAKNRERINETARARYAKNPEKSIKRARESYWKHREKRLAYYRAKRAEARQVPQDKRAFGARLVAQTGGGICEGAFLG